MTGPERAGGGPGSPFAELSRIAVSAQPLSASLTRVSELARQAVPGVAAASVTLVEGSRVRSVGLTGPLAAVLDERQYDAGFGPCVEAALTGTQVLIADTADEAVHRDFAALARRQGVTSVLSVGLPVDHGVAGSLNLYATGAQLDTGAQELAAVFARYATTVVTNAADYTGAVDLVGHLRTALGSRSVIDQAKGILMERYRCGPDQAFRRLAAQSQSSNRKLRDLAADLVASVQGASPDPGQRGPDQRDPGSGPR